MEVIKINKNPNFICDLVACVGQFDGLHIAHRELINKTIEIGKSKSLKTAMITFDPHPDFVINKNLCVNYLTPLEDKIKLVSLFGLDYLIIIHFDEEIMNLSKEDFVNDYLIALGAKEVVVGFDFSFGKFGSGKANDITKLSNNKITTTIIDEIKVEDKKVGSTLIRELLSEGNISEVNKLMKGYYTISSKVIKGDGIGKFLGFPTANLDFDMEYVGLKIGVYSVIIDIGGINYKGLCNYGYNPSLNSLDKPRLEVFIKDFNGNLYDKIVKVSFVKFIREERKYTDKTLLIEQIKKDLLNI